MLISSTKRKAWNPNFIFRLKAEELIKKSTSRKKWKTGTNCFSVHRTKNSFQHHSATIVRLKVMHLAEQRPKKSRKMDDGKNASHHDKSVMLDSSWFTTLWRGKCTLMQRLFSNCYVALEKNNLIANAKYVHQKILFWFFIA